MHGDNGERAGTGTIRSVVLRAWLEPGDEQVLRIRMVEISPGHGEQSVTVTASVDEACDAVRHWLEALRAQYGQP